MRYSPIALLLMAHFISPVLAGDPAASATAVGGVKFFEAAAARSKGNLCLSPFSIQSALAMTYGGAEGKTRSEMAAALDFPADASALAASFESLNASLLKSAERGGKDTALNVANRLFGAEGFAFRSAFLALCKDRFGAPLGKMDFRADPAAAAQHINQWVEKQTVDRIRNLIPENALTRDTTLVLANALYLKTPWAEEFSKAPDLVFHVDGGSGGNVPAITRTDSFGYRKAGGFTLVSVPFRGGEFQFLILLPDGPGPLPPLTADILSAGIKLPSADVALTLPKFRLEPPTLPLGGILQSLGMKSAFDIPQGSANFDGIAPRRPDDYLYISDVFHKVFFALDEKGIEAAAATAVVMMRATAMPVHREPVEVCVDRPFYFAVQHVPTGACLFLGRITDPR
ncbi:MAG: serpin family protein [Verrucomicrobiaceae bacterium]|nr:MAG: serpin family protein [Verrucomicrobiaceae bacterium]